ncbi:hypothetical protein DL764_006211 [Monosporascus ibericus]|uniref:FAD-binding domain-containing protein n=1 Tax=Monosporascus ibericus TaxID=155417 RepID=A0A4Q4T9C3_9PEZI|nr:hypothetical protein DL764_006211 [Monosporascus ibericus]
MAAGIPKAMTVIIVGAGPSGLLLALNLAREGIVVRVLESASSPDIRPRATHYGPAGVHELRRSGVLDSIVSRGGLTPSGVAWRFPSGEVLAELPQNPMPAVDRVVSLPLNLVVEILLEAVRAQPTAEISFGHRVLRVDQADSAAWVEVETDMGAGGESAVKKSTIMADYVVGCDGASSTVRRCLFGDSFPGFTWDPWLVAVNVRYGGFDAARWSDINFVIHPTEWCMAARIGGPDGLWRVTFGEDGGLSQEECAARVPDRLRAALPGQATLDGFDIVSSSPYRIHQRCAPQFRVGRILLAADAAHLCNPMGGMGLTSGIVDVGGLSDCLIGIHRGVATDGILDKYASVRRGVYENVVDRMTTANLKRLMTEADAAVENDDFLKALRSATGPESATMLANVLRTCSLEVDKKGEYLENLRVLGLLTSPKDANGNRWAVAVAVRAGGSYGNAPYFANIPMGYERVLTPVTDPEKGKGALNGVSDLVPFSPINKLPIYFVHHRLPKSRNYVVSPPDHPNTLALGSSVLNLTGFDGGFARGPREDLRQPTDGTLTVPVLRRGQLGRLAEKEEMEVGMSAFQDQSLHLDFGAVMFRPAQ